MAFSEGLQGFSARLNIWAMLRKLLDNNVAFFSNAGAPTSGTSGTFVNQAGPSSLLFDYTNGQLYINTNTLASPTWSKLADSAGDISLAQGSILVGNASGLAAAVNAKTSAQLLLGNGTTLASVAMSGDATIASSGAVTLGAVVNGSKMATVADLNVIGGGLVVFRINASALTGDIDVTVTNKIRVMDVMAIATAAGGAADTITVKNAANAISNDLDLNVADKTIVRASTLDDAFWEIAAAGTLRVSGVSAATAQVYVTAMRVA